MKKELEKLLDMHLTIGVYDNHRIIRKLLELLIVEQPEQSLQSQITQLRKAILTLTVWLAQTHVFGQQDVDAMEDLLK